MSGAMNHMPSDVIRELLIDLGLGTDPVSATDWSTTAGALPDQPDKAITVHDTESVQHGRSQIDGETQEHHGIQVMVRSDDLADGYTKTATILRSLDTQVNQTSIEVDGDTYMIYAITRRSAPILAGMDGHRFLHTANLLVAMRMTAEGTGT